MTSRLASNHCRLPEYLSAASFVICTLSFPSLLAPSPHCTYLMFTNNPYAQGGWYNPQNPASINGEPWRAGLANPPTFGALPAFDKPSSALTFTFSSFNPDFLNCTVIGPQNVKYFDISTPSSTNKTTFSKPGLPMGSIEWRDHPVVDAPGIIKRQLSLDFLKLSGDRT